MSGFSEFILQHENDDTGRLLLNREKFTGIDMTLAVNTILCRKKLKAKAPLFHSEPSLIFPNRLSAEQCSSEETAKCKVQLILSLVSGDTGHGKLRIADLTGGLGVDTAAFAAIADKVLYNEMNRELAEAARHNFKVLGLGNVTVCSAMIVPQGNQEPDTAPSGKFSCMEASPEELPADAGTSPAEQFAGREASPSQLLSGFRPDIIFLDPARRAGDGRKVFLIEECSPDILTLKDEMLTTARFVMVKLSPMADIDMVTNRLGRHCRLVEAVSIKGECKELLAVLDRKHDGECTIIANCGGKRFAFTRSGEAAAAQCVHSMPQEIFETAAGAGRDILLLEPDKALMKTAPFNLLCKRFGLHQLDKSTHYFIADSGNVCDAKEWQGLFKAFRIIRSAPLDKRSIKDFAKEFPEAEVTARNIPMTSELLRNKLGVSPSDEFHIFGLRAASRNRLFACRRLP